MSSKRNSALPFKTSGGLSLAAAKPLSPNELSQSYTPATDDVQHESKESSTSSSTSSSGKSDHIKVICRFRPKNSKERAEEKRQNLSSNREIAVYNEGKSLEIPRKTKNKPKLNFTLDNIIWSDKSQEETFIKLAQATVESVIEGYNCTIFAFGQTGSGKTYTMFGPENLNKIKELGIIPRSVDYMFKLLNGGKNIMKFNISLSICEVYKEMLRDLLTLEKAKNRKRLEILSSGKDVRVKNLTEKQCDSVADILKYIVMAQGNRAKHTTDFIGHDSSRSHCVVMISITQRLLDDTIKMSKLNFGDLAGSELASKTGTKGSNLKEAGKIHQGLLALENVINALVEKKNHIPYNDSKLTRLLSTSIGGNSKTTLLVTCSPSIWNRDETISTLRFAKRAKKIKNIAKINKKKTREQLESRIVYLENENMQLKKKLQKHKYGGGKYNTTVDLMKNDADKNKIFGMSAEEKEKYDQVIVTKDNEINNYLDEIIKLKDLISKKDDQFTQIEEDLNNKSDVIHVFDKEKKQYELTINKLNNKLDFKEKEIDKLENKLQQNIELQTKINTHTENLSSIVNDSVKDSSETMILALKEITSQQSEFYNFLQGISNNIEKIHEKQITTERDTNDRFDEVNQMIMGIGLSGGGGTKFNDYEPELSILSNSEYDVTNGGHGHIKQQTSFNFDEDEFDFGNRKLSVASIVLSPEQLQIDEDNKNKSKKQNSNNKQLQFNNDDKEVLTELITSMRSYLDKVKDDNEMKSKDNNNQQTNDDVKYDKNMFSIGKKVDVLDVSYNWYSATIKDIDVFDKKAAFIKYDNFEERWNEWIPLNKSYRIAPHKSRTKLSLSSSENGGDNGGGIHCLIATKYGRSQMANDLQLAFNENNNTNISNKTILIQGHLYKQSNWSKKNWKRRWFVIRNNHNIYYYDHKNMKSKNYRGIISLGAISAIQMMPNSKSKEKDNNNAYTKFSFIITTSKNKSHFFSCNNQSDLIDWISTLECLVFTDCHQINIKSKYDTISKPVYYNNNNDDDKSDNEDDNTNNKKQKRPISPRLRQSFSGFADKFKKMTTKPTHQGPYTASIEQID